MDIKWLEDFISLSKTRNFSRSAAERNVTQSAFSRRIQSLESWLGVELFDRNASPLILTNEGRKFQETAEESVRILHLSRLQLRGQVTQVKETVTIATLQTLGFRFFPEWFREVIVTTGFLTSRIMMDDLPTCSASFEDGSSDF